MHFVYVMSRTDKAKMEDLGYELIKEDANNLVWVFKNKDVISFSDEDEMAQAGISFVLSDVLTF